ncbi:hypothetical protein [Nocardiopsis sp. FIRDI 009]|uniref:hypothetical protein n=1 Tax=Nocardiopsis sp. FIRDI 009 TaxID=714197 RepID=UPI0018E599A0|nr:hypothetical protein [Nocardiopsis sp. FIRDI 009]
MEIDVAGLSDEGARVLVGEMTKTGWSLVRGGFASLFGRGAEDGRTLTELEEARQDLLEDPDEAPDIEAEWRRRLKRLLREDPEAAEQLRALLDECAPDRGRGGTITNTNIGDVHGTLFQVGKVDRFENTQYSGDHVDLRGAKARGGIVGTQDNHHGHGPERARTRRTDPGS